MDYFGEALRRQQNCTTLGLMTHPNMPRTTPTHASLGSLVEAATSSVLVSGSANAIATYFSEDYVAHVTDQEVRGGHALIRSMIDLYRKAFSDLSSEVVLFLESEDTIAWRRTLRATQTGAFKGFPASGRTIVWQEMVVSRIAAGRIAEEWIVTDLAERLLQSRKAK